MHKNPLDLRAPIITKLRRGTGVGWLRVLVLAFLDGLMLCVAWSIANRFGTPVPTFELLWRSEQEPGYLLPILVITLGNVAASGLYGTDDRRRDYFSLIKSLTLAQIVLLIVTFLYDPELVIARSTFILAWILSLILVCSERFLIEIAVVNLRRQGTGRQKVFLIGAEADIESAQKFLKKTSRFDIRGQASLPKDANSESWNEILAEIQKFDVSEVFVCSWEAVRAPIFLYWELMRYGIHLRVLPIGLKLPSQWSEIKMIDGLTTIRFRSPPILGSEYWLKRGFDLVLAAIILAVISPVFLAIALLIKLDSPGPIFYKQKRVGLKGSHFLVWKFRTMVTNAEQLQKQLEAMNEMKGGVMFKMKNDPRVTRIGHFLRRYSLDELPQIINVLRGEMSLVGPRPFPLRDVEGFSEHHFIRHEVLPGITGLWQVSGRSDLIDFEDVFLLDITYIQNWSLSLDFQILFQTIKVVLQKEGAY